jgi:hypothetical protein
VIVRDTPPVTPPTPPVEPEVPAEPEPEVPAEPEPEVPSEPEPEVPVVDEPVDEEVVTPPSIVTVTLTDETGEIIQTLTLEEGSIISEDDLDLPDNFKGLFLDGQTCSDDPFDLDTPITENLTLIQVSFNNEAPCIQLDYIVLSGRPTAGSTLSVDIFPLGANVSISWYTSVNNRTYREIPGETESTFTVRPEDSGKFIRVYVVSDSNPPVVRYDTIKMDVFSTLSNGGTGPVRIPLTEDETTSASALIDSGIIPIAYLEDLIAINSTGSHIFAGVLTTEGGLSKSYALLRDIDLSLASGTTSLIDGTFTGTFDGKGNTLSGLIITANESRKGLFKALGTNANIENLILDRFEINASNRSLVYKGFIAGEISNATDVKIHNIIITNSSMNLGGHKGSIVGGILYSSVMISNIDIYVEISNMSNRIGGVVGYILESDVEIKFITTSGIFTTDPSLSNAQSSIVNYGGIIGELWLKSNNLTLSSITNNITITGSGFQLGGVIGSIVVIGSDNLLTVRMDDITNNGTMSSNQNTSSVAGYGGIIGFMKVEKNTLNLGGSNIVNNGELINDESSPGNVIGRFDTINDSKYSLILTSITGKDLYNLIGSRAENTTLLYDFNANSISENKP